MTGVLTALSGLSLLARWWVTGLFFALGFSAADAQDMRPFAAKWGAFTGVADRSGLNKPISPADQVTVQGPHFMRVGPDLKPGTADDSRVRLFGINLSHEAAFPSRERASEVAATLRSMGFNAVRLHHMDTLPTADQQVFRSTLTTAPYPTLHTGAIERLRHFISALRTEGLYVNLNLMVGYTFRPGVDGVPPLDDKGKPPGYASPVHSFYPLLIEKQVAYARQLLRALHLKNEPGLAQVEIMNESSLAAAWLHWHAATWSEQIAGAYAEELNAQWKAWVLQRHGSWDQACAAWQTCGAENQRMPTPAEADALQHGLPPGNWIKLKAKLAGWWAQAQTLAGRPAGQPPQRHTHPKVKDALQFVADVDKRFIERMRAVIQEETHVRLPVTGTQVNFGAPLNFASHAQMDFIDAHYYLDHPEFPGTNWSDTDWRIGNTSMAGGGLNSLLELALYRDPRRPFVVSEFNQPHPNTTSYEILPVVAASAAQQDWDGLYFFDYADGHTDRHTPHNFNLQGDWTKASVIGLAALIYRTPSIASLRKPEGPDTASDLWWSAAAIDRRPDTWVREFTLRQGFQLDSLLQMRGGQAQPAKSPSRGQTGTSEIALLSEQNALVLEAPLVEGVLGETQPGQPLKTAHMTVEDPTRSPGRSMGVVLHSVDGLPLADSRRMLLAVPAWVTGSLPGTNPPRPQLLVPYRGDRSGWTLEPLPGNTIHPSSSRTAVPPLWVQRTPMQLRLALATAALTVYPLDPNGRRLPALPTQRISKGSGQWLLDLNQSSDTTAMWYELVAQ